MGKKCSGLATCKAGMKARATKGLIHVGCKGTKASLNAFFDWAAHCCDPKNIGFSDNIDMFKMQITSMPVYHNMGTTGRFKAYHGAGSVQKPSQGSRCQEVGCRWRHLQGPCCDSCKGRCCPQGSRWQGCQQYFHQACCRQR